MHELMPIVASGRGILDTLLGIEVIYLMPLEVVLQFALVFIIIGFIRGVRAEAWVTAFILMAYGLLWAAGDTLIEWTNRFYKLTRFALAGGIVAENPVEIWEQFVDMPPLIQTETEKLIFRMVVFLIFFLLGFLMGRIRTQRVLTPIGLALLRNLPDLGERLLGAILGAVNGFLVAYFVLPATTPQDRTTVLVVPEGYTITEFMTRNLVNIGFIILVIIILLGLMASGGIRQRG